VAKCFCKLIVVLKVTNAAERTEEFNNHVNLANAVKTKMKAGPGSSVKPEL
jgi:hypothetical protein